MPLKSFFPSRATTTAVSLDLQLHVWPSYSHSMKTLTALTWVLHSAPCASLSVCTSTFHPTPSFPLFIQFPACFRLLCVSFFDASLLCCFHLFSPHSRSFPSHLLCFLGCWCLIDEHEGSVTGFVDLKIIWKMLADEMSHNPRQGICNLT